MMYRLKQCTLLNFTLASPLAATCCASLPPPRVALHCCRPFSGRIRVVVPHTPHSTTTVAHHALLSSPHPTLLPPRHPGRLRAPRSTVARFSLLSPLLPLVSRCQQGNHLRGGREERSWQL
ncbi:hypothetical protein GUJ93_ZPchr0007g3560 [Zizania palustris]|uniref:Secreted protein n=1 Tax=Zizania palustris TaxID=103762 RepID=A0A8J5TA44_ZIZPA|nr:hypothetical protein GUJ93_ZPchr0007g3560 [Zizania palustris]